MKQVFILGRNPELSRQEIFAYLRARGVKYDEVFFERNILLLESDASVDIQELGGTMKAGKNIGVFSKGEFYNYMKKNELVPSDKFSFVVYGNGDAEILKAKFKAEKKKAVQKQGRRKIRFQDGDEEFLGTADFNLFFHEIGKNIYFGLVEDEYDYSSVEKRDMGKPVRREELAISPRLSKILINLSEAKEGDFLLDPFCGIGGILIEALVKNINVFGIDKDRNAVNDAEKNLKWLLENYGIKTRYTLKNSDALNVPDLKFDAIATETPLGELLKKKPSENECRRIIENFERLIVPILRRFKVVKKPMAKIAITFPVVGRMRVNIDEVLKKAGLELILDIAEIRPGQFV